MNLCLSCIKFNKKEYNNKVHGGYYKNGRYYENGKGYNTCSGFPMWKGYEYKKECHNYIKKSGVI